MGEFANAFATAFNLIVSVDRELVGIVLLSLNVTLSAVGLAALIGVPLGAVLALFQFPGRAVLVVVINAFMGLPPVVAGLLVYLALSRSGPLGTLGLLFTPTAMIIAQCILVTPIVAALSRQVVGDLWREYAEQLRSLGAEPLRALPILLWDGRLGLITAVVVGFGRASAEVGAVMIVGGNIDQVTRVMTTAIALETSRGELSLALALGMILMILSLILNALAYILGQAIQPAHR